MRSNDIIKILKTMKSAVEGDEEKALGEAIAAVEILRDLKLVVRCADCKKAWDNNGGCMSQVRYGRDGYCSEGVRLSGRP